MDTVGNVVDKRERWTDCLVFHNGSVRWKENELESFSDVS